MSARYAIYFSPADDSALARYGERVLRRTAGNQSIELSLDDYTDRSVMHMLSSTPAHYGFHATLKAPFHLRPDASVSQLLEVAESLAARHSMITMDSLSPKLLSGFMALCFETQPAAIEHLAEQCLKEFEPFRAPLTQKDIDRRNPDQLNEVQRGYLNQYGYPFVLSEFQFHLTLTGKLDVAKHPDYIDWLYELYKQYVPEPPLLDRIAVFWQSEKTSAFTRLAQFPFS